MYKNRDKGFTLVELLVVISILGILAAALTTQVTRSSAIGQSMRCKANLRNLGQAALSYGVDYACMPSAGSFEYSPRFDANTGQLIYIENRKSSEIAAWVSWTGSGNWPSIGQRQAGSMTISKFYVEGSTPAESTAYESIRRGSLWSYVGKDLNTYCCDVHRNYAKRSNLRVLRSYVMNSYFGYADEAHGVCSEPSRGQRSTSNLAARGSAANLLLFAELPARDIKTGTKEADSVLEAKIDGWYNHTDADRRQGISTEERIGFNHEISGTRGGAGGGKRYGAHVVFADGHVDVLIEPHGAADKDLKELTRLLCNGYEITDDLRQRMR